MKRRKETISATSGNETPRGAAGPSRTSRHAGPAALAPEENEAK